MVYDLSDIDWYIWEPVDTAHICEGDRLIPLNEDHWNSVVLESSTGCARIVLEVGRDDCIKRVIKLKTPSTIRDVLCGIHAFYSTAVRQCDLDELEEEYCEYKNSAEERMRCGEVVRMHELNGSPIYLGPKDKPEIRRHPFECCGYVRFEGLEEDPEYYDKYNICLGS